jgi:hypothetical protein
MADMMQMGAAPMQNTTSLSAETADGVSVSPFFAAFYEHTWTIVCPIAGYSFGVEQVKLALTPNTPCHMFCSERSTANHP